MKLRTKSNSIRLRLTQSEVSLLQEKGIVEEVIYFPDGTNLNMSAITIKSVIMCLSFYGIHRILYS